MNLPVFLIFMGWGAGEVTASPASVVHALKHTANPQALSVTPNTDPPPTTLNIPCWDGMGVGLEWLGDGIGDGLGSGLGVGLGMRLVMEYGDGVWGQGLGMGFGNGLGMGFWDGAWEPG